MKHSFFSSLCTSVLGLSIFASLHSEPFTQLDIPWQDQTPYESTTERFLKKHPFAKIDEALKASNVSLKHKAFYDIVTGQEERGHIGYNASGHNFRIFQDIIRITLEEVLELEFKKDFYFFRLPHDENVYDFYSGNDFIANHHPSINDNLSKQRDQLISTNFTPYGNFEEKYECTAVFFEKALSFRAPKFDLYIQDLFDQLGIPSHKIPKLFEIGQRVMHPQGGSLFQFFDLSYQDPNNKLAYEFVDRFAYPCIKKGEWLPDINDSFSELFQNLSKIQFDHQYRLVVNRFEFLNPYSSLHIRRYDLNDPETVKSYEDELRSVIRKLPFDPFKAQYYKKKLLSYWLK